MSADHFLLTVKMAMARSEILTLYRRLLRLHDRLPGDFGALGRKFVQEEFKRHKTASPDQAKMFTQEWTVSTCTHQDLMLCTCQDACSTSSLQL